MPVHLAAVGRMVRESEGTIPFSLAKMYIALQMYGTAIDKPVTAIMREQGLKPGSILSLTVQRVSFQHKEFLASKAIYFRGDGTDESIPRTKCNDECVDAQGRPLGANGQCEEYAASQT